MQTPTEKNAPSKPDRVFFIRDKPSEKGEGSKKEHSRKEGRSEGKREGRSDGNKDRKNEGKKDGKKDARRERQLKYE